MSCWVAPNIAAEIWGLSLGEILALIASGRLLTCISGDFSFVRLPQFASLGQSLPPELRPSTFNIVGTPRDTPPGDEVITPEERAALVSDPSDESEMGPPPDEDPDDNRIAGWREGRKRAGVTRRGPKRPATSL